MGGWAAIRRGGVGPGAVASPECRCACVSLYVCVWCVCARGEPGMAGAAGGASGAGRAAGRSLPPPAPPPARGRLSPASPRPAQRNPRSSGPCPPPVPFQLPFPAFAFLQTVPGEHAQGFRAALPAR